jgi:hypothetical protein
LDHPRQSQQLTTAAVLKLLALWPWWLPRLIDKCAVLLSAHLCGSPLDPICQLFKDRFGDVVAFRPGTQQAMCQQVLHDGGIMPPAETVAMARNTRM